MTGGYFMLDGLGIELTGDPKVYAGSWDAAVEAVGSGKPIIAYNTLYATAPVREGNCAWLCLPCQFR